MTVYISEFKFTNSDDFVEIVATDGEEVSGYKFVIYASNGTVEGTYSLGGVDVTYAGTDGYVITRADGLDDIGTSRAIALVDDTGTVLQFIGHNAAITAVEGPANGQTSTAEGNAASGGQSYETNDEGASYYAQTSPNPGTIPCFAPGTMIDTPDGPRAVETLQPGDLVETLDSGPMPVLWARQSTHWLDGPQTAACPIRISAGALGPGCPAQDLIVSPQHRVLAGGTGQLDAPFLKECFVPAKALTVLPGVREMRGKKDVTWVHFACETHQIVVSNGCRTESLLLGPMVRRGLTIRQRSELDAIFGPWREPGWNGPPARPCLDVRTARQIVGQCRRAAEAA